MSEENVTRKLVAILYADVVGYSRLTGADEEGTHRTLAEYLDAIAATVSEHYGYEGATRRETYAESPPDPPDSVEPVEPPEPDEPARPAEPLPAVPAWKAAPGWATIGPFHHARPALPRPRRDPVAPVPREAPRSPSGAPSRAGGRREEVQE